MGTLDKFKRVKVMIGVPSLFGWWHHKFSMSHAYMLSHWQHEPLGDYRKEELVTESVQGSILPNLRLDLVKKSIALDCTHLCLIDTDQSYPKDTLHRLIKHDKDVVACNIATKQVPSQPTARLFNEAKPGVGDKVYNVPGKGLQEVWRVGAGVMLIRLRVFETLGLNVWGMPWQESAQRYQGEDWSFVEACEKAKIKVYIDHDLSEQVKHWGDFGYDHNVVGEVIQEKMA